MVGSREPNINETSWKVDWKGVKQGIQQTFKNNPNKALLAKLAQQAQNSESVKSSQVKQISQN